MDAAHRAALAEFGERDGRGAAIVLSARAARRKGAADRSYGVQVAQLAGLPKSVVARARVVLDALEQGEREGGARPKALIDDLPLFAAAPPPAPRPVKAEPSPALDLLQGLHPDEMTPREALDALYKLKEAAKT